MTYAVRKSGTDPNQWSCTIGAFATYGEADNLRRVLGGGNSNLKVVKL